jgi:hypothetical protein
LLETVDAFEPDLVIAGHCDMISNATLLAIKRRFPDCAVIHCNNDPLFVPSNVERIKHRASVTDAVFVSTGRRELTPFEGLGARVYHMPNPVDAAIENLNNANRTDLAIDLLFCSNATKFSTRGATVQHLKDGIDSSVRFRTPGSFDEPPAWGRDYDRILASTRMALNLNRQEGDYWYTSDRMAQLAGNGILQFTHASQGFQDLLPAESMVYFNDNNDLLAKVLAFHHDDAMRQAWAARCRQFFHDEINTTLYARYIVEATLGQPFSHEYVWARDINPDGSLK